MQVKEFNTLVDKVKDRMYRLAYRMVQNQEEAKDIVQESLVKIWKKFDVISQVESKEAYCMTITRNMSIDKIRARKMSISDIDEHYNIEAKSANPEATLVNKDEYNRLLKLIKELPENHRTVIELRDIEGYSYKEISALTGYTVEKVKVYLHRARTKLRHIIKNKAS